MQLSQLLDRRLVTVDPATTLRATGQRMLNVGTRVAVVVDESGEPVGLLTLRDFLRASAAGAEAGRALASEWMTPDPPTAELDGRAKEVAAQLSKGGSTHVVVMHGDAVAGVLSLRGLEDLQWRLKDVLLGHRPAHVRQESSGDLVI